MNNYLNKKSNLDSLEQKLYSPRQDVTLKERKGLVEKQYTIPQDWEAPTKPIDETELQLPKDGPNWFFRIFMIALVFFIGAAGFAAYMFFWAPQSINRNINILINAPLSVGAGEPFNFEVMIENKDPSPIILADLVVQFPDGTRMVSDINSLYQTDAQTIDRIEGGTVVKKNYSALLFGEENQKKDIEVFLTYRTEDSTAFFEKEKTFDTILNSTPVRVTVNNITETTSGQDVTFTVELVSNSTQTLKNILVEASLPFGFMLKESSIPLREDKKSWLIPELKPRESFTYTIKGSLEGQQGDDKFFKFVTSLQLDNSTAPLVAFNTKETIIKIKRPFLELKLDINQKNAPIIILDPEKNNNAQITFKNNTEFPIRNAEITLSIIGDVLRKTSVQANQGFYQSLTNMITWNNSTNPDLSSIAVGDSEIVSFSFSGLGLINDSFLINPELNFSINIKGNRNPEDNVIDTLENTITQIVRFNTETSIQTKSEYYSSIFQNTGPIPPKAESKTTYTATVQVLNTSNEVQNSVVTMRVPTYVQYEGVYSPSSENVSYDPVTRLISWNIGAVPPKTGYQGNQAKRLSLQVSIVPSVSQLGQSPELLNAITFSGIDSFTQTQINKTIPSITTAIIDSQKFGDGQVTR
jgi:hypothetical protein